MVETIPEEVLAALETVRASGATNMYDRNAVIFLAGNEHEAYLAADWLEQNKPRYMEALKAMGARRTREA